MPVFVWTEQGLENKLHTPIRPFDFFWLSWLCCKETASVKVKAASLRHLSTADGVICLFQVMMNN